MIYDPVYSQPLRLHAISVESLLQVMRIVLSVLVFVFLSVWRTVFQRRRFLHVVTLLVVPEHGWMVNFQLQQKRVNFNFSQETFRHIYGRKPTVTGIHVFTCLSVCRPEIQLLAQILSLLQTSLLLEVCIYWWLNYWPLSILIPPVLTLVTGEDNSPVLQISSYSASMTYPPIWWSTPWPCYNQSVKQQI